MRETPLSSRIGVIAWTNLQSALLPVFYCAYAALLMNAECPVSGKLSFNVLLMAAVYTFPLLVTGIFAQFFNTRYSVRNVIVFVKIFEIMVSVLGGVFLLTAPAWGPLPLFLAALLLGGCYSGYRPALKIYTSALIERPGLSLAAGFTEFTTFAGILAGAVAAVIAFDFHSPRIFPALFPVLLAFAGLALAYRMVPVPAHRLRLRFADLPRQWFNVFRKQQRYRELVITGIGESYIFASIILTASIAIHYIGMRLRDPELSTHMHLYTIMASPVFGAAAGCLTAGFSSRRNVEIGIVPPATIGMFLTSILICVLPYSSDFYIESGLLAILLAVFGYFAGKVLVPVQAYQEFFVQSALAPAFFSWFYLPFGIAMLLAIGLSFLMYWYDASLFIVTMVLASLTLALGAVSFYLMPQFLLRWFMRVLMRTLYRLRIHNAERIPERGPAVLIANRASFVDMLFISACTSRPIRFMMHESYFRYWLLYPLVKSVGFLEVPSNKPKRLKKLFEETAGLLRKGELICLFPEDDITRNGTMSSFKDGVGELLPAELDVPVIPVRIGMTWGSIFSCFYGKFKLRWPNELPHPASVTVGLPLKRTVTAYEIRIALSELAAETELKVNPEERPFHTQFAVLAKRHPFRRRILQYDGTKWQKPFDIVLLVKSVLISRFVRRSCAPDEEYVGVMLPNSLAAFTVMQGVLMADKIPAIMNFTAGAESNGHAVRISHIRHILTSRAFLEKIHMEPTPGMIFLEDAAGKIGRRNTRLMWTLAALIFPARELMKFVAPESWDDVSRTAVLIFSSGSTGIPKGIMLTHHNINADTSSVTAPIGWSKNDCVLGNLPMFHSFGLSVCIWLPVTTGGATVLIPNPVDAAAASGAIREGKVSLLCATPAFLMIYMRRGRPEDFKPLRLVITGAEKLRDDIAERFRKFTGLEIAEGYGCTELSPIVSVNMANSVMELGVEVAERGTIGPPIPGVCVKIVDPSTFALMPENTDGLLIVKGATVMKGYLNEPEKTHEVIRDGWYVTGDIARMNRNGFITITGRLSRFSKIAGEMVPHELVEREINNLLRPEDRLVAVCGATDLQKGEKLLVFYTDTRRLAPEEVVRRLRERDIPNLWIPRQENFIHVEHLPLLGSGKLDLAALRKMAEQYSQTHL